MSEQVHQIPLESHGGKDAILAAALKREVPAGILSFTATHAVFSERKYLTRTVRELAGETGRTTTSNSTGHVTTTIEADELTGLLKELKDLCVSGNAFEVRSLRNMVATGKGDALSCAFGGTVAAFETERSDLLTAVRKLNSEAKPLVMLDDDASKAFRADFGKVCSDCSDLAKSDPRGSAALSAWASTVKDVKIHVAACIKAATERVKTAAVDLKAAEASVTAREKDLSEVPDTADLDNRNKAAEAVDIAKAVVAEMADNVTTAKTVLASLQDPDNGSDAKAVALWDYASTDPAALAMLQREALQILRKARKTVAALASRSESVYGELVKARTVKAADGTGAIALDF